MILICIVFSLADFFVLGSIVGYPLDSSEHAVVGLRRSPASMLLGDTGPGVVHGDIVCVFCVLVVMFV